MENLQVKLLSCLVLSPVALREHYDDIRPDSWIDEKHKYLVGIILQLYNKVHVPPTKELLLTEVISRNPSNVGLYKDLVDAMYSTPQNEIDGLYIDKLKELIKTSSYMTAHAKTVDLLKKRDFSSIDKIWQKAMGYGSGRQGIDCFNSDEVDAILSDDSAAYGRQGIVPTMYTELDRSLRGGAAAGELHVIVAPPNKGKSRFLTNLGYRACVQGFKVLRITAEIQEEACREQLWQCMAGLEVEELRTERGRRLVKEKCNFIASRGGEYHVKYFDPYTYTMNHVESYMIRTGRKWDLLITDYLDLFLLSGSSTGNYWIDQTKMWAEGRRLADRMNVAHWTASQPQDVDTESIIHLRNMGGSKGKGATADGVYTLNSNAEQEKLNKFNLFIAKSRVSRTHKVIPFHCVPEKMLIREGEIMSELRLVD